MPDRQLLIGNKVRDLRTGQTGTFHGWTRQSGYTRAKVLIGGRMRLPLAGEVVMVKRARRPEVANG